MNQALSGGQKLVFQGFSIERDSMAHRGRGPAKKAAEHQLEFNNIVARKQIQTRVAA
jgi:hypothetical protein